MESINTHITKKLFLTFVCQFVPANLRNDWTDFDPSKSVQSFQSPDFY